MMEVKEYLEDRGAPVFMVNAVAGQSFAEQTMLGMKNALAMVAFCTENYGEKTDGMYETYMELKYAYQNQVPIIPLKLSEVYPPKPPDADGRAQNKWILSKDVIYIDDSRMEDPCRAGQQILETLDAQRILSVSQADVCMGGFTIKCTGVAFGKEVDD